MMNRIKNIVILLSCISFAWMNMDLHFEPVWKEYTDNPQVTHTFGVLSAIMNDLDLEY